VLIGAALAVCLLSGIGAAEASGATGDLVQKPGAAGCLSVIGFCERGSALDGAESVTVSPDGQNAYAVSSNSDAVTVFDRASDGTLTQKPGPGCISDTGAGFGPSSVALSPDGTSAYVASSLSDAVAVFDREPSPPAR
jgi:DNA-binding beta-propeller fold protein YncE